MLDNKDSLATNVRVEICYSGGDCIPSIVVQDWTPASQFAVVNYGGDKRSFVFKKTQSGDMRWRVTFRDAQGTQSVSEANSFTIP